MADELVGVSHDLVSLLSSKNRDFLINNSGNQVEVCSLVGKIVGLYFSASWCRPCRNFTPNLVEVYEELLPKGDFEVVLISSDRDDESFKSYFSKMPWLAIPYPDEETRKQLKELFKVKGIPFLVFIDGNGVVCCDQGVKMIREYGKEGYPFSLEKVEFYRKEEETAKKNQTLCSVLVSSSRDYLISKERDKVHVSELEGKMVGLYFSMSTHPPCLEFTPKLEEIHKKLKENGEKIEIVWVSLDYEEKDFKEGFGKIPWLALPFEDISREKLARYFELNTLPTLVIIGEDGKTMHQNVADLVEGHGINAYPFSAEKLVELAEIDKARNEAQTLESVLVHGDQDFVIEKSGSQVQVSELVGRNILLYFSAKWCPPCRAFLPKLVEIYHEIKAKDNKFEVIFISGDRDQSSFDEFYSEMTWLALPFGDERITKLQKKFKIKNIPAAVAISPKGPTLTKEAKEHLMAYGADAYPFTEHHLNQLAEKKKEPVED